MGDEIPLTPQTSQVVLRKLGMHSSSYLGNDLYFLIEAINLLRAEIGDDVVKKSLEEDGYNWDEVQEKLRKVNKLATQIKVFYDPINDKKFDRKDINENKVQSMFKDYYMKTASKLSIIQPEIYKIFIKLVKMTNLKNRAIPSEAFKIIEHSGFKKIDNTQPK